jgi:hypothetical protein
MSLATLSTNAGSLQLPVVKTFYGLHSMIEEAQLHTSAVYYPVKVLQDNFKFTVQFRKIEDYTQAQNFIHQSNQQAMADQNMGLNALAGAMRFNWPEMGLDYSGYIINSPMGYKKWDFAPRIEYTMMLVRDSIYSPTYGNTNVPTFNQAFGNDNLNTGAAVNNNPALNPPAPPAGG